MPNQEWQTIKEYLDDIAMERTIRVLSRIPFTELMNNIITDWDTWSEANKKGLFERVATGTASCDQEKWVKISGGWTWSEFVEECVRLNEREIEERNNWKRLRQNFPNSV